MRLAGVKKKSIEEFASFFVAHPPEGWQTQGDAENLAGPMGEREHVIRDKETQAPKSATRHMFVGSVAFRAWL
jgi:hypothetical protein